MRTRMLGTWAVVIACGVLAFAGTAEAASVQSLLKGTVEGNINQISDDSWESLTATPTGTDANGVPNGTLGVGDVIRGIFTINSITSPLHSGSDPVGSGGNNQLTGIFQTKILAILPGGASGTSRFVFGPDPAFSEAGTVGLAGTAMVLFFEDKLPTAGGTAFTTTGGLGSVDESNATDGKFWMALGMSAAPSAVGADGTANTADDWTSSAGEGWITADTQDPPTSTYPNNFGTAKFALNRLFGSTAAVTDALTLGMISSPFGASVLTNMTGTTEFGLNSSTGAWPIIDETRFFLSVVVPIPAAAWMGFALLGGLGLTRRLRRRNRN